MFFCELSGAHDNTITPFKRDDELFRPLSTGTRLSRRGGRAILTALGCVIQKRMTLAGGRASGHTLGQQPKPKIHYGKTLS